jgi:hypothetical protein
MSHVDLPMSHWRMAMSHVGPPMSHWRMPHVHRRFADVQVEDARTAL